MKIIIVFILFTVQAQYDDLITQNEQRMLSTIIPDVMSSNEFFTNDFGLTTSFDDEQLIVEEQWFSVNQSSRRESLRTFLSWKPTARSRKGANYILTSDPRCLRQMCSVRLKYNGTLPARISGCLSFSIRTRGQPDGQLWIVEDQESENSSQKIQLINKPLQIEHSLRSRIRNLSIETKIMFRNPQTDALLLSNLNLNWRGPCPKKRRVPTPSPHSIDRRATFDDSITLTSEVSGSMMTLSPNEEQDFIDDLTTTVRRRGKTTTKRPFHFMSEKNIGWFLSLVSIFCFLTVLSAGAYNLWLFRAYHHFTWYLAFDTPIRLLGRRSLRSSTRSDNKVATISDMVNESHPNDLPKEETDVSVENTGRSSPLSHYTYL